MDDNLERALSLRNVLHLPTTQCACADFGDFAKRRNNGGGSREKDLLNRYHRTSHLTYIVSVHVNVTFVGAAYPWYHLFVGAASSMILFICRGSYIHSIVAAESSNIQFNLYRLIL
jgi:hypothetical protein